MRGTAPRFEKLDEDYRTWSTYCRAFLKDKGVWTAVVSPPPVVGPEPPVAGAEAAASASTHAAIPAVRTAYERQVKERANWERMNEVALSNIMMAVKPHLLPVVEDCTTASQAWDNLRVLFVDDTTSRRADLEDELRMLKMTPGEAIIKYVGRAKGLRNELATASVQLDEHSLVLHILRGLPAGYGMIKTVLKNNDAPLRLPTTTAKLLGVEKELAASGDADVPPEVQAYLARMKVNDAKGVQDDKRPACFYCKKPGHRIAECRKRLASNQRNQQSQGGDKGKKEDKSGSKMAFSARVGWVSKVKEEPENAWLVDSGATHHLAMPDTPFKKERETPNEEVTVASGDTMEADGNGVASVILDGKVGPEVIKLPNTYLVPELEQNMMSVGKVDIAGGAVLFGKRHVWIFKEADVIVKKEITDKADAAVDMSKKGLYLLGGSSPQPQAMMASAPISGTATVWHRRYFHLGYDNLQRASKMVNGMPTQEVEPERVAGTICRPCVEGKMVRSPFPESSTKTSLMQLLHVDITGPFPPSLGGSRYLLMMYEDSACLTMGVPIQTKSGAGAALMAKIPELERRSGKKLQSIRFDGAKEFLTGKLRAWFQEKGIDYQKTLPYSPQSNGKAERVNRTVKERVRAALAETGLGEELWAEAAVAAIYVMNRSPKEGLDVTPWESFTGERPDVSGFAVWGSTAHALKPAGQQRAMQPRTAVGTMVGYTPGGRGYRLLLDGGKEIFERRDVAFEEATPEGRRKEVHWGDEPGHPGGPQGGHGHGSAPGTVRSTPVLTPSSSGGSGSQRSRAQVGPDVQAAIDAARMLTGQLAEEEDSSEEVEDTVERYPGRDRRAPERYGQEGADAAANAASMEIHPVKNEKVYVRDLPPPPKTVAEAKRRDDWELWKGALQTEHQSIIQHKVWRKQKAPPGARRLKTRTLFEYKANQGGELERPKCRFVGLGNRQMPGQDYQETWAPMPAAASSRALLGTAAARGWHVHHLDVRTAYLYAPMDMEVFIQIPDGFDGAGEDAILLQAIYGTKQAGHFWAKHLDSKLTSEGGSKSVGDVCLYTFDVGGNKVWIEVHVDDLIVCGPRLDAVIEVKSKVARHFSVRDMGEVSSFLGMQVK